MAGLCPCYVTSNMNFSVASGSFRRDLSNAISPVSLEPLVLEKARSDPPPPQVVVGTEASHTVRYDTNVPIPTYLLLTIRNPRPRLLFRPP